MTLYPVFLSMGEVFCFVKQDVEFKNSNRTSKHRGFYVAGLGGLEEGR